MSGQGLYIDNRWAAGSGPQFGSTDPATGAIVWRGTSADAADVERAVAAARRAAPGWAALGVEKRLERLRAYAVALKKSLPLVAEAISKEVGKPLWESKTEVQAMVQKVEISAEAQAQRSGLVVKEHPSGTLTTRHHPLGVMAVFGPFNFPGHLPNGHIIPALLAGNTVVFKPSELAPLAAQEILKVWEEAGLPEGVLNMVQGGRDTGAALAANDGIDGLLFTGSFSTGKKLSEVFGSKPEKILALEMGGNNPLVVGTISDRSAAALAIVQSAYITSGQRCTCARRLIVADAEAGRLIPILTERMSKIKIGPYTMVPEPFMGPVISAAAALHIHEAQKNLLMQGAKAIVPSELLTPGTGFLSPGLLDITGIEDVPDEEIFGPLLLVVRVKDFASAIHEANRTSYGLAAGLLSDSRDEYETFLAAIRAGVINWNVPTTGASSAAPFGGVGRSGNHRPSAYYAADYCSYPVASIEATALKVPPSLPPGLS